MRFALHPHQADALAKLRASLLAGARRPMVQAPTGAGKTVIAATIIEGALAKKKRVLFVAPFLSLIDQTVEAFAAQGIASVGVMQGYHPLTDPAQPVQVCSMQTLQRRRLPKADLVIVDEAHRWYDFLGKWMAMPEWQNVPFIGLSATPWTKGLGKRYDDLIVAATTADLITKGFLSPFKVYAPSHPDLTKVRTKAGDYHEGDLADVMSQPTLIGDVVATWLRLAEDRPTLVFAVDRAHARKLADEFEAAGVPCGYVDALTERDERERIGQRLRNGQIKVVANVGCLTTGVDWDIRCIVLARPTKSEALFCQIVGRGLRTAEGKDICLILDHSDTTLRLGFVSDIHHDTLDNGKHQTSASKGKEKAPPLPKECKACSFLKPAGVHKCPSCGFEPERQSMIEEREGSLVQLNGRRKSKAEATPHDKQTFYGMCLWHAKASAHKSGSAAWKYKDRFGVWPRGLTETLVRPDDEFVRWMLSSVFGRRRLASAISVWRRPMRLERTADRAVGQWRGILGAIGLPARALTGKHGPCPMCGGKDRFRLDDKGGRGTWICSQCGAGDGVSLVMKFLGVDFRDAAKRVDQHIGEAISYTPKGLPKADEDKKRKELAALWSRSRPIEMHDYAGLYLNARTGLTTFPDKLRFAPDERYVEIDKRPSFHPAMVAKVDPSDEAVAAGERASLHRTYLSIFSSKAEVASPRKMFGSMPSGAAVRLAPHDEVLGIAEGIETALSASILFNVPCWSALNAGLMQEWTSPAGVSTVFVFGDNDVSNAGQAAAYVLAQRLKVKGFEIIVEIPGATGQDWNDVLMRKLEAE